MPLLGKGVLAIWNGTARQAEDDFIEWHVREHIPERVALPGFLRGRRYVAVDGFPKYFNFYETATADALLSPVYQERLNAPTEWTRKVVAQFTDTSRSICDVAASTGVGEGGFVDTLRLSGSADSPAFTAAVSQILQRLLQSPGIVAAHLLKGRREASGGSTTENRLRSQPNQVVDWIMLIEAVDIEPLQNVRIAAGSDAILNAAGARLPIARGSYRLQYGLVKGELAAANKPV
jgi:hypothetical protein